MADYLKWKRKRSSQQHSASQEKRQPGQSRYILTGAYKVTLQEQLRRLTSGGLGVTFIASETLFEDAATALDRFREYARHKHPCLLDKGHPIDYQCVCGLDALLASTESATAE